MAAGATSQSCASKRRGRYEKMPRTIQGTVQAVKQKEKGYALLINKEWFNDWGTSPAVRDDEVKFISDVNDKGFNVMTGAVEITKKAQKTVAQFAKAGDSSMAQMKGCALKAASILNSGRGVNALTVLEDAEKFLEWLKSNKPEVTGNQQ